MERIEGSSVVLSAPALCFKGPGFEYRPGDHATLFEMIQSLQASEWFEIGHDHLVHLIE